MSRSTRDNQAWLDSLREGGAAREAALRDLREMLLGGLRRAVPSFANSAGDSILEDVTQDALLRVMERLEQFEGRSRFVTWATSIAIRLALTELRRRRWKDVSFEEVLRDGDARVAGAIDREPLPDSRFDRKALVERLQSAIEQDLTEKQRTALLAELRGMPQEEIARHLGSNRNAVYKLTHDARKRLKRALEADGYGAEDVYSVFAP